VPALKVHFIPSSPLLRALLLDGRLALEEGPAAPLHSRRPVPSTPDCHPLAASCLWVVRVGGILAFALLAAGLVSRSPKGTCTQVPDHTCPWAVEPAPLSGYAKEQSPGPPTPPLQAHSGPAPLHEASSRTRTGRTAASKRERERQSILSCIANYSCSLLSCAAFQSTRPTQSTLAGWHNLEHPIPSRQRINRCPQSLLLHCPTSRPARHF
jgi:hypothetical protein